MNQIKEKTWTHRGTAAIIFLLFVCVAVLLLGLLLDSSLLFMIVIPLLGLLYVYKITITIDNVHFSFKLGIGLIKKSYRISDIKSCTPITSQSISISTKMSFSGQIRKSYIVTGFKAIELQFHDSDTIVHIGTPQSEEISEYIQSLLLYGKKNYFR